MIRLFVGLRLPQQHNERLSLICHGIEGARWVEPQNLHLTLRFIGDVDENIAEDALAALNQVQAIPFDLSLGGLGTFGHPAYALWLGVKDKSHGGLAALQDRVENVLVRAGLMPEGRKFTPHITLAKIKRTREKHLSRFIKSHTELVMDPFKVEAFTLFQSHLTHAGAQYEGVKDYGLEGLIAEPL